MAEDSPLTELVDRHRRGDPDAARQIFEYYSQRLGRLAEQYLSHRVAGRVEGVDIVQSVFRAFFKRAGEGAFKIDSRVAL